MTEQDIERIIELLEKEEDKVEKVETHASWVLLSKRWAYKFKKPLDLGFLDFSTPEERRHYCEEEVHLNRRLAPDMYRGVVRVLKKGDRFELRTEEEGSSEAYDHGVMMKRMDPKKQMDRLLSRHEVRYQDVEAIARMLAPFHRKAERIEQVPDIEAYKKRFNDIQQEEGIFEKLLGKEAEERVERAIKVSNEFLDTHQELLQARVDEGMVRDGHGDLHSGNIFIDEEPVIFDCIEFNPAFRRIDILDEIAFFCMDLEAHQEEELASHFLKIYNQAFPVIRGRDEEALFEYYKAYRANVRAKVTAIRASQEKDPEDERSEISLYLDLMDRYLDRA